MGFIRGCPPEYEELFKECFNEQELELIKLDGIGNNATFELQIKILSNQTDSEVVYIAEDDYYYFPNQFKKMIQFLKRNPYVDFITPYDHADYYSRELYKHKKQIIEFEDIEWKTSSATSLTFLTTKKMLKKHKNTFDLYSQGKAKDVTMWLCLTKIWVFHPLKLIKYYNRNRYLFNTIKSALYHGWKQILFGRRRKLWYPSPTIATHMVKGYLSPRIDWKEIFIKELKNFEYG